MPTTHEPTKPTIEPSSDPSELPSEPSFGNEPIVLQCIWWSYTSQPQNRPDCSAVHFDNESANTGFYYGPLADALSLCESLNDANCNTVERGQTTVDDTGSSYNSLSSCPSTNPDELDWVTDTRYGWSINTAITYFYICSTTDPTHIPSVQPTSPTLVPTDVPTTADPTTEPTMDPSIPPTSPPVTGPFCFPLRVDIV